MSRCVVSLAVALTLGLGGRAAAEGLAIGDPAPKLEVKEFVKGDPVQQFDKGKIYVVEFWATWCGPCRVSIPHITDLQKKYKDVVFIGVSVWEQDQSKVKPFVAEMGDKMAYRVAVDDVADGDNPNDGKMARNWMSAAEQSGIPSAFVVNGEGRVAWIGHPMSMDRPLQRIVAGKWDLQKAAVTFKKAQVAKVKLRALMPKLVEAQKGGDTKAVLTAIDDAIKSDPEVESAVAMLKYRLLNQAGDADKQAEYVTRMADEVFKDDQDSLNNLAWAIVEKPGDKPNAKLMQAGLRAAKRADELAESEDPNIADTLAKAYFETGDAAKALEHQERALKLAAGTDLAKDPGFLERLETYRKANKK